MDATKEWPEDPTPAELWGDRDSLDAAWTEAVAACAALPKVGGISCWPKLQGPLPVAYQPEMYQAQVNDVNGGRRDDERIGIDPSPAAALRALAAKLRGR